MRYNVLQKKSKEQIMAEDTERKEYGAEKENRECRRQDPIQAKKKKRSG